MPEGDTIFRTARMLDRALGGSGVVRFETVFPRLESRGSLVGRRVLSVSSRGKWILMRFSGDLVLLTHLRMHGSWRLHPLAPALERPPGILVVTERIAAGGHRIPVADLLCEAELERHRTLPRLGPDPLAPGFDPGEVLRRLREREGEGVGRLLLDQTVLAGVGNVFKSEVLFLAGVHPEKTAGEIPDEALRSIVESAARLLRANASRVRRSTLRMDPAAALFVYRRSQEACRRCGERVQALRRTGERTSYVCPRCQPR